MKEKKKFLIFIFFLICLIVFIYLINRNQPEKELERDNLEEKKHGNLIIKIPSKFQIDDNTPEDRIVYYDYYDKDLDNTCILMLEYKDAYDINLEQEAKNNIYVEGDYQTEEKDINNHKWNIVHLRHNIKAIYHAYATTYNDKIYVIKYDDIGTGDYCDRAYKKMIKTIEFRE